MVERMIEWLTLHLGSFFGKHAIIFIISMIPILELRGGLIAASPVFFNIPLGTALPLCILGNILPIPFILLLITKIFNRMKKTRRLKPLVDKLEKKAMKNSVKLERYEFLGLVLFVGIPLPGTGAWTGALLAALLGIRFRKAFPAILVGILLASIIMSFISYGVLGFIFG